MGPSFELGKKKISWRFFRFRPILPSVLRGGQKQKSPCLCGGVAGRRPATPSHKHRLCPPLGFQLQGPLKVQRWVLRCLRLQGLRSSGLQVFRSSGLQVFRFSGLQVFRSSGLLGLCVGMNSNAGTRRCQERSHRWDRSSA